MESELATIPFALKAGLSLMGASFFLTFWLAAEGSRDCGEPAAEAEYEVRRLLCSVMGIAGYTLMVPNSPLQMVIQVITFLACCLYGIVNWHKIRQMDALDPTDPKAVFLRASPLDRLAIQVLYATFAIGMVLWIIRPLSI